MSTTELWRVVDTDAYAAEKGVKTKGKGRTGPALYYSHGAAQRVATRLSNLPGGRTLDGGGRFVPRYVVEHGLVVWDGETPSGTRETTSGAE